MPDNQSAYSSLYRFISEQMAMSHIYQPVMLKTLLERAGEASVTEIAEALLTYDSSQVEYYELRVKNMVGEVLTKNRGITTKLKSGNQISGYSLNGYTDLTPEQVETLKSLCDEKIASYLDKRSKDALYNHRSHRRNAIPGSVRYRVLKRAHHRCELCGISADQKALDLDHIIPKSLGGSDDESNFQALCYTCNGAKSNKDDTDLRDMAASYGHRDADCPFCTEVVTRAVDENELAIAFLDGFPVTEGHTLVIPKRHVSDYFDLHQPELNAIQQLLGVRKAALQKADPSITGFNVGVNAGQTAGQTVFHCHVHLIPRREGDMDNPKGGVRGVIPDRQKY